MSGKAEVRARPKTRHDIGPVLCIPGAATANDWIKSIFDPIPKQGDMKDYKLLNNSAAITNKKSPVPHNHK